MIVRSTGLAANSDPHAAIKTFAATPVLRRYPSSGNSDQSPCKTGRPHADIPPTRGHAVKKIHSASTSHQPQATSGDIVIEIPAQQRNDASTRRIDSPSPPCRPDLRDDAIALEATADMKPTTRQTRPPMEVRGCMLRCAGKRSAASGSMTLKTHWNHQLHRPRNTLHNMAPKRMHPPLRQALRA